MDAAALGEAIARGLQAPFQVRAERIQRLMGHLFGPAAPSIPSAPFKRPGRRALRSLARDRRRLSQEALDTLEALLTGRLEALEPRLCEVVIVHWADGSIRAHPRAELLSALKQNFQKEAPAIPVDGRLYDHAELRAGVPEALADGLDAYLGLSGRGIVTARLDGPRLQLDRIALLVEPTEDGTRLASLPLVALDEAWVAGQSAQGDEDEGHRIADRAVRHQLLGHGAQLRSLRNQCLRRIFLDDELLEAEEWPPLAAARCDLVEAADRVLLGVRRGPSLKDGLGLTRVRMLEQKANQAWQHPLDSFRPRLALVKIGRWDPHGRQVADEREIPVLLGRQIDRDVRGVETERWRLAGLWPKG